MRWRTGQRRSFLDPDLLISRTFLFVPRSKGDFFVRQREEVQ